MINADIIHTRIAKIRTMQPFVKKAKKMGLTAFISDEQFQLRFILPIE